MRARVRVIRTLFLCFALVCGVSVPAAAQSAPPAPPNEQAAPPAAPDPATQSNETGTQGASTDTPLEAPDESPDSSTPPDPDNTFTNAQIMHIQTGDHVGTFILPDALPRFRGTGLQLTGIRFGWNGRIRAERHTPIWIKFDSGENSVQGVVMLEYTQDASQRARVVAPFSTTPNAGAIVELVACMPASTTKFTLRISDGDVERTIEVSAIPAPDGLLMPTIDSFGLSILGLHEGNAHSIVTSLGKNAAPATGNSGPTPESIFASASLVSIDPAELAQSWQAYDSVDVLVAREDDLARAPQRARDAIHTWVRAGGHLVVQVSAAAQTWRQVVPEGVPLEISFDERAESATSSVFNDRVRQAAGAGGGARELAPLVPMRMARWDKGGPRDGVWSDGWSLRLVETQRSQTRTGVWLSQTIPGEACIASGPVGFGRVTLVGVDPMRLFPVLDVQAAASAWRAILWDVLPEHVLAGQSSDYYGSRTSGASTYERQALGGVLDAITIAAPVGPWFFLVTAGAVGLLVLAVGPLGRLVLRRKGWQRSSWIVALSLSAVACLIGLFAPMLVRSGQSITSSLAVHDVICDQKGEPVLHAQTNLRAVFSGKPETITIRESEGAPEEGRWWRGVSSAYLGDAGVPFGSPLTLVLTQPAPGVARTAVAMPTSFGQWTYRAFLEQRKASGGADAPPVRADIRLDDQNRVQVRLRGLDPARRAVAAWLYTRDGSAVATKLGAISESGVLEAVIDSPALPRTPVEPMGRLAAGKNWTQDNHAPAQGQDPMTWYAGMLPGPAQRTAAINDMVFAEGPRSYAMVVIGLRDAKADAPKPPQGARATYDFDVVRLVVPASDAVLRAMRAMQGEIQSGPASIPPATSPKPDEDAEATEPSETNAPPPDSSESPDSPPPSGALR